VQDRGSDDPNPATYRAPFWKNGESEPVKSPDWGWCGSRKKGVPGGGFPGGFTV
jgi:hypothetical protein